MPDTLFLLVGPDFALNASNARAWRKLRACENVAHREAMPLKRLADVFAAATIGIIPYTHDRLMVRNGFPLKTLEMVAAGLPVVTTPMDPLRGLSPFVSVCDTADDFIAALRRLNRSTLSEQDRAALTDLAAANDYNRKFEAILHLVAERIPSRASCSLQGAKWGELLDGEAVEAITNQTVRSPSLIERIRHRVPPTLVHLAKRWLPAPVLRTLRSIVRQSQR